MAGGIDEYAQAQRGLITRAQALGAGLGEDAIDHRVERAHWLRVCRSVYLTKPARCDERTLLAAGALAAGGAAAGECAAALWGMDAFEAPVPLRVVSTARVRMPELPVSFERVKWLRPEHVTLRHGVPVLTPSHLLLHLGEHVCRDQVEWALDHCLRRCLTTWNTLTALAHANQMKNRPGARVLRELLALRSQRQHTDSVLETLAVQLLRNAGLGEPVLQYPICVGRGVTVHADLAYPEHNLLIETVGVKAHRSELRQYSRDCRRLNAVNLLTKRYVVLHYTHEQLTKTPHEVIADVAPRLGVPVQECFRMLERPGGRAALYVPH